MLGEVDGDGAVVGAEDVGEDFGLGEAVGEGVGDAEVVDAPADVALACAGAVGPPGVGVC